MNKNIVDPGQTPWRLIWVCTVCQLPFWEFPDKMGKGYEFTYLRLIRFTLKSF